jgi:hypothetical protein
MAEFMYIEPKERTLNLSRKKSTPFEKYKIYPYVL